MSLPMIHLSGSVDLLDVSLILKADSSEGIQKFHIHRRYLHQGTSRLSDLSFCALSQANEAKFQCAMTES
jgi:hypothetical protein